MSEPHEPINPGILGGPMEIFEESAPRVGVEMQRLEVIELKMERARAALTEAEMALVEQTEVVSEVKRNRLDRIHAAGKTAYLPDYLRAVMLAQDAPPELAETTAGRLEALSPGEPVAVVHSAASVYQPDGKVTYKAPYAGAEITFGLFQDLRLQHDWLPPRHPRIDPELVLSIGMADSLTLQSNQGHNSWDQSSPKAALLQAVSAIKVIDDPAELSIEGPGDSNGLTLHDYPSRTEFGLRAEIVAGNAAVEALLERLYSGKNTSPQRRIGILICAMNFGLDPNSIIQNSPQGPIVEAREIYRQELNSFLEIVLYENRKQLIEGQSIDQPFLPERLPVVLASERLRDFAHISYDDLLQAGQAALVQKAGLIRSELSIEPTSRLRSAEATRVIALALGKVSGMAVDPTDPKLSGPLLEYALLLAAKDEWPPGNWRRKRRISKRLAELATNIANDRVEEIKP